MATCAVSGNILDPSGTAITSVTILARVTSPVVNSGSLITPLVISTQSDSSGNFTLTIQQSISVIFTVQYPPTNTDPQRQYQYTGTIPATTTASFTNVITIE
jgi:hypothetical protein